MNEGNRALLQVKVREMAMKTRRVIKAFGDDESAGTADTYCSLRASGVCRILRGGANSEPPSPRA